jgi:uncharacterized membrane protein
MTVVSCVSMAIPFVGVIVPFLLSLAIPLHRDHPQMGMWTAMKNSATIVCRYFCGMIGYLIVVAIIVFVAVWIPLGTLVVLPIVKISHVFLYHHLIGINGAPILVPQSASSLNHDAVAANPLLHVGQEAN